MAWKRLKPRTTNKRFLAVLAALAAWREREAQARDIPRGRVLKDEALTEIAAHPPETRRGAGAHPRRAQGLCQFQAGQGPDGGHRPGPATAPPPEGAVAENRQRRRREPSPAVMDLLKTLLRLRAEAADVAPRLIANAEEIERLAAGEDDDVPPCMAGGMKCSARMPLPCARETGHRRWKMARPWWWN